ncbi:MAG TPA: ATP-binding cassette domain-containing protein, partial [Bacillota bacterium]|nr:ATP-binding cassette domain-containing protein [Bacillota bacterium]
MLELIGVTKKFGGLLANDNVSMKVEKGQIYGIIGPNGAGKTTLFNCITGFLRPEAGRVIFEGRDITSMPANLICRAGIARTFQIVQVLDSLTVQENA